MVLVSLAYIEFTEPRKNIKNGVDPLLSVKSWVCLMTGSGILIMVYYTGGWTNPFEKYDRQIGSFYIVFAGVGVKIKSIWNHHLVLPEFQVYNDSLWDTAYCKGRAVSFREASLIDILLILWLAHCLVKGNLGGNGGTLPWILLYAVGGRNFGKIGRNCIAWFSAYIPGGAD